MESSMTETHSGQEQHGPSLFRLYMIVAAILAVCTLMSFVFNQTVSIKVLAFVLILSVAIIKAVLVAMYFMHLKWDWKVLYFLIIPAFILGTMMMMVLLPDIVIAWHHDPHPE
jgi:cytochrome c oxidase subunit 4